MTRQVFVRQWVQQAAGALVLVFIAWAFLNTPDREGWHIALSGLLGLAALALGTWLVIANFTGTIRPRSRLFFTTAALLVTLLSLRFLLTWAQEAWGAAMSAWLASATTLAIRKPVTPAFAAECIEWTTQLIRWIALPLVFIPLMMRAGGAWPARYGRFVLLSLAAFLMGAIVPHYLVHWVPKLSGFWPQVISAAVRFLFAYLILITAWVLLGSSSREEAPL